NFFANRELQEVHQWSFHQELIISDEVAHHSFTAPQLHFGATDNYLFCNLEVTCDSAPANSTKIIFS
ncbi:unnamed protein product, partial [Amoebophrya sp. A25]